MKLARIHSAVLSGLTPVLGAIAVGFLELEPLIILFFIGILTHIFGFTFNEYMDIDIDKRAKHLKNKPLVSGTISEDSAITFALGAIIIGYVLIVYLIHILNSNAMMVVLLYTISWLAIAVYDLTSKSVRGSDLALAVWTGTLCLMGGFAVTNSPNFLLFIIAGLAFLQLFIQNILAGLKDISQDKFGSGTTTPIRLGVTIYRKRLDIPFKFQGFIYSFKFLHLFLVFIPFLLYWLALGFGQLLFILLFIVLIFYLVHSIFNAKRFQRNLLLRKIGLHEILSYSIVPVMFFGIIGLIEVIFLIILPIVWLAVFMKFIYGRLLPNI
jgi:4-hydroxybenzoate polyprenyltransferase